MLTLDSLTAGYGDTTVLRGVDFTVADGEVVALLGPNGAGKTTLLKSATGFLKPRSGKIWLDGNDVTGAAPYRYTRRGVCHLPEGRGIFPSLSVRENLVVQARGINLKKSLEDVADLFPVLARRLNQTAGSLSGGEQQMLALSRAYLGNPKIILVDEPSLGLAPRVIDQIYEVLARFVSRRVSLVIVEQYVQRVLDMANRVYILSSGQVIHSGAADELDADMIYQRYLGVES
jgi:branched-chain amino acid transport system ATP-binding protein